MRILSINGSQRRRGNTAAILTLIEAELNSLAEAAGETISIDRLEICDVNIQPCMGCRLCFDRGEDACPLKDDLLAVKSRFDQADGFLCGSPVYVGSMSGSFKTLIDKIAFVCHRPAFYGKPFTLVATTAGSSTGATLNAMTGAFLSWGAQLSGRKGFTMGARMRFEDAKERFSAQTKKISRKFFRGLQKDNAKNPGFLSLMIFKTQQATWSEADPETIDYQYWDAHGWTDPRRTYFTGHHANFIKVGAARLVGGVLYQLWGKE
jgi:multimeric flavodoxin WrbA